MLVLTRKRNETIILDDSIVIKILQVKGNRIRIGVSAPADVNVRRGELHPFLAEDGTLDVTVTQEFLTAHAS